MSSTIWKAFGATKLLLVAEPEASSTAAGGPQGA